MKDEIQNIVDDLPNRINDANGRINGGTTTLADYALTDINLADGWIHAAYFYINDKEVMNITFADPINISENYYNLIQGDLNIEKIGKFLLLKKIIFMVS